MHWSSAGALGILGLIALAIFAAVVVSAINSHYEKRDLQRVKDGPPPKRVPPIDPTKW